MGTFRLTLSRLRVGRNHLTLPADQLSAGSMTSRLAFGDPARPKRSGGSELPMKKVSPPHSVVSSPFFQTGNGATLSLVVDAALFAPAQ